MSEGDGNSERAEEEGGYGHFLKEVTLFFGGLFLIFLGLLVSAGILTAVIGVPMAVVGYMMYRSSNLAKESDKKMKIDYRDKE
ncbi:MAG: hypothetical protein SV760_05875 [Halobacteria archaeon]|nr:hypothetical protein [Halobacteria archaeon]